MVQGFSLYSSVATARNLYSALLWCPPCYSLKFEICLRKLKRQWNSNRPKYDAFYNVQALLSALVEEPLPVSEEDVRLRVIILLRFIALFRGCDLATAKRPLDMSSQPWMLRSTRKGRLYEGSYPVIHLQPMQVDPQYWVDQYCRLTSAYQGEELLCSVERKNGRIPLKSATINSLTTKWLRSKGVRNKYTAHSTRGAAATTLIHLGISPGLVQAIGDWQNGDCFQKFYNRAASLKPHQQILIKCEPCEPLPRPAPSPDFIRNPVPEIKQEQDAQSLAGSDSGQSKSSLKIAQLPLYLSYLSCHVVDWGALLSFLAITMNL